MTTDLFGWTPDSPAMTPEQRRLLRGESILPKPRSTPKPSGHAREPGTGPVGETCGSCANLVRKKMAKTYLKCGLAKLAWTGGRKTDVLARDAACAKWEPLTPPV